MPNIRFSEAKISWMNIFSLSLSVSVSVGQRQFSLSDNFSDYNNILITRKKDTAHFSTFLLKSADLKFFFAKICKKLWEIFLKTLMFL